MGNRSSTRGLARVVGFSFAGALLFAQAVAACGSSGDDGPCSCSSKSGSSVHQALACKCDAESCPSSINDYDSTADCSLGAPVVRKTGCGRVAFSLEGGYSGGDTVFDERSGALVGLSSFSDTPYGSCENVFSYVYGEDFRNDCDHITSCTVCGSSPNAPPCD